MGLHTSRTIYSPGTVLEGGTGDSWKVRSQENTVGGKPSPNPGLSALAAPLLRHGGGHCHGEVDIFTSRLIFSGSLSKFLEPMGVSGSGDCGALRQQLPVQHASRVPSATEEEPV